MTNRTFSVYLPWKSHS